MEIKTLCDNEKGGKESRKGPGGEDGDVLRSPDLDIKCKRMSESV